MEEQIREIVGSFLKTAPAAITAETRVDRKALGSSIMLHRMYARLAEKGVTIDNYHTLLTYSELLQRAGMGKADHTIQAVTNTAPKVVSNAAQIGIDIEQTTQFNPATDYRSDAFYTMNYTPEEISYAILQPDPIQTFAGLFAAKEAIMKADNRYRSQAFNEIAITYDKEGKPGFQGMAVSITHAGEYAIAVAVVVPESDLKTPVPGITPESGKKPSHTLAWLAIVISILSLLFTLYYH